MIFRTSLDWYDPAKDLLTRELVESLETAHSFFTEDTDRIAIGAWSGSEVALGVYSVQMDAKLILDGWFFRPADEVHRQAMLFRIDKDNFLSPAWWDDESIALSHQSFLSRDPRYNKRKLFRDAPRDWPILHPFVADDDDYDILVSKKERGLMKNLPKKVKKMVRNA